MDAAATGKRILLVDDEVDILSSLQSLLQAMEPSWEVETATSGPDGLKAISSGQFDIIVSDYRMPEMDGLAFLREARKQSSSMPLVLMTAFPDLQIAITAINEVGIQNFFTKPLDPEEIIKVLREILAGKARSSDRERAFARAMKLAGRDK